MKFLRNNINCVIKTGFLILLSSQMFAQNYVRNSDFESHSLPPSYNKFTCDEWKSICGSVDYYNVNSMDETRGVPNNKFGYHSPHNGDAYIGLIVFSSRGYQEFIQCRLTNELTKGQRYRIQFYVKYSNENTCFSTWQIGAYLSEDIVLCVNNISDYCPNSNLTLTTLDYNYLKNVHSNKYKAQIENEKDYYLNSDKWTLIEGIYKATGGEKYLTLGGFYIEDKELDRIEDSYFNSRNKYNSDELQEYLTTKILRKETKVNPWDFSGHAYYFIDDVSVVPINEQGNEIVIHPQLPPEKTEYEEKIDFESVEIGKSVLLEEISFEYNSTELLPESYSVLNNLVQVLKNNDSMEIEIVGHTDNSGSDEYNLQLSQQRARKVVDYIVKQGIEVSRLSSKGYGNTKPIGNNLTEGGRAKNRRVEFIILKK